MSDETTPQATPETTTPALSTPSSRYAAAASALERLSTVDSPPPAAAPAEPAPPSAAAMVLGGTKPDAATPIDASDPKNAAALAQIVALEQAARRDQAALAEQRAALQARERQLEAWAKAEAAKAGGDPLAALQALGMSYEDLTAYVVSGKATGALSPATEELERMRAELEALPKRFEEQLAAEREAALNARVEAYKTQVRARLASDRERWELLHSPLALDGRDPVALIEQTIEAHWRATGGTLDDAGRPVGGERLTPEAAADMLESEFERRLRESAVAGTKLRGILGLTSAAPTTPPAATAGPAQTHGASAPDLSDLASRGGRPAPQQQLTAADYRRRGEEVLARELRSRQ
jgi:hypothetical protein